MKSIFSYFIIILTSWTIFSPLHASLETQRPAQSARRRLRSASESAATLAARKSSLDLENFDSPPRNTLDALAHPDNSDRSATQEEAPPSKSAREKLMKIRQSIVTFTDPTISPKSNSERSNSVPTPLATTQRIQEIQPQPAQTNREPQESRVKFYLEAAGVSTLAGLYLYAKRHEEPSLPTRFITGMEPLVAGAIFKGVLAYGSTILGLTLTGYSLYKINRWIHRSCRSDLAKAEEKFGDRLAQHVREVNIGFVQMNRDLAMLASSVETMAEALGEILPPEQAEEMQVVHHNAKQIKEKSRKPLKVPVEPGWWCC
ncbi:hypothetical protein A3J41_00625 [candidate division TM6 bacterium RIFCSPHIGHO2_12_FULL_38_8]|nr:MAG: hypothetical protein A3J41_00625 [candidate division TM6 bacterium RIFCSPHIGHO2_12_FULL_38_8]